MDSRITKLIEDFTFKYKYSGIHVSNQLEQKALNDFKDELIDAVLTVSATACDGCENKDSFFKTFLAVGYANSKEAAKKFNEAKIPNYQPFELVPSGPPVELDDRFFFIALSYLDPEYKDMLRPYLEDYYLLDRFEHPDYIGPDIHPKQKVEGISDETVASFPKMEDVSKDKVIEEYFKTFDTLKVYITSGDYDDPNAKKLYDRMNQLQTRIVNEE